MSSDIWGMSRDTKMGSKRPKILDLALEQLLLFEDPSEQTTWLTTEETSWPRWIGSVRLEIGARGILGVSFRPMQGDSTQQDRRLLTDTKMTGADSDSAAFPLDVPALTIVAHPEPARVGETVALPELISDQTVELSRVSPLFAQVPSLDGRPSATKPTPLAEAHISRSPVLLAPGPSRGSVVVDATGSRTPLRIDRESVTGTRNLNAESLKGGVVIELAQRVVLLLDIQPAAPPELPDFGLIGASAAMLRLRKQLRVACHSDASVLILGESGAGKELVARGIHEASRRSRGPYVAVNMSAIPPSLAASELFGAQKGAYTGADAKKAGFFQRADGGTLFLDEIGETPADIQPLLLRALENGEIQPVGGDRPVRVDVRALAATDADLEASAADGTFRRPLFHRLAGFEIHVPPLRHRRADIGRLFAAFLEREHLDPTDPGAWPSATMMAELCCFDWPGNVRQLYSVVRRWAAGAQLGEAPNLEDLLGRQKTTSPSESSDTTDSAPGKWVPAYRNKEDIDFDELMSALRAHRFELKPTATALNISRTALYDLIERHPEIRKASDIGRQELEHALGASGGDLEAVATRLEISLQGLKRQMKKLGLSQ